jgi:hypothetical protein
MKKIETKRKSIHISMPEKLHTELKVMSAKRNMSMTDYILQCLIWRLQGEK